MFFISTSYMMGKSRAGFPRGGKGVGKVSVDRGSKRQESTMQPLISEGLRENRFHRGWALEVFFFAPNDRGTQELKILASVIVDRLK